MSLECILILEKQLKAFRGLIKMKIDMLSMAVNFKTLGDTKITQGSEAFSEVFTTKLDKGIWEEELTAEVQGEEEIEENIAAMLSSLLNNITLKDDSLELPVKIQDIEGFVEKIQQQGVITQENLKEVLGESNIEKFVNNLNLKDLGLNEEDQNKLFLRVINKLKETVAVSEELNVEGEEQLKTYKGDSAFTLDYTKNLSAVGIESEAKLFNQGSFKHRNIIVEEKSSNPQGELSLLNKIAFSTEDVSEVPRDTAPVVVRNQYLGPDVLKVVKYLSNNQIQELNVKITPKELGEVNIKLVKAEESNELIITLNNKKAFELIKDNVNEIEKHLATMEIKIKNVVVQVKNEVFSDFSGSFNEQFNKGNSRDERQNKFLKDGNSFEEEETTTKQDDSNINLLI